VLISTVDVYPEPVGVVESTVIDNDRNDAYGRHRRNLEELVESRFSTRVIVRLPGLFGDGMKKNIIYDLLNENRLDLANPASVYQFYDLECLWRDIRECIANGIELINVSTAPLSVEQIAADVFGRRLENTAPSPAAKYDMRSEHCGLWNRTDGYLYGAHEIVDRMRRFVERTRSR
jgi:nucleoside-diphosphate-sugar epimerase